MISVSVVLKFIVMNKFKHFVGIDISKEYFDTVLLSPIGTSIHNQFCNDLKGVKSFQKWLKSEKVSFEETLVCMEYTGMYGKILSKHLISFGLNLWMEMSFRIIRSMGVQRGKNDKIDAERIAKYAQKNQEEALPYRAPKKVLEKIRALLGLREKLVAFRATLLKNVKEMKFFDAEISKINEKHQKATIKGLNADIKKIEKQLEVFIAEDENIETIYKQTTSVPGVGKITALLLICFTNEFTLFEKPREIACYCGVVPFEYTSGKSVRGKPKVHFMANKKLKKQLHMCALSSIVHHSEMKIYFQRKVAEGKNKMLVLNNVRNKIIHRICACVRENKLYEIRNVA